MYRIYLRLFFLVGKQTKHINHFKIHMRTHKGFSGDVNIPTVDTAPTKKKQFLCSTCGRACTSQSNLIVHTRRHTGKMTNFCDICGKGYPRSTDLTIHMRLIRDISLPWAANNWLSYEPFVYLSGNIQEKNHSCAQFAIVDLHGPISWQFILGRKYLSIWKKTKITNECICFFIRQTWKCGYFFWNGAEPIQGKNRMLAPAAQGASHKWVHYENSQWELCFQFILEHVLLNVATNSFESDIFTEKWSDFPSAKECLWQCCDPSGRNEQRNSQYRQNTWKSLRLANYW